MTSNESDHEQEKQPTKPNYHRPYGLAQPQGITSKLQQETNSWASYFSASLAMKHPFMLEYLRFRVQGN